MYCAVWTNTNSMEIRAAKFEPDPDFFYFYGENEVINAWHKMRRVSFEMDSICHIIHANGKLFVFGDCAGYGTVGCIKVN